MGFPSAGWRERADSPARNVSGAGTLLGNDAFFGHNVFGYARAAAIDLTCTPQQAAA